jgi:hypothetical protein
MNEFTADARVDVDASGPPIQLTSLDTTVLASAAEIEVLRTQFEKRQYVRLRNLIPPTLLGRVARAIDGAAFYPRIHKKIGVELGMAADALAVNMLRLLVNRSRLFRFVQHITSCGPIGCFDGRVYRMLAVPDHYDSWHDDLMNHRRIGMSLNVSSSGYEGGTFQLRDVIAETEVDVPNTGFGDAILFRLGDHLKHRVTAVEGKLPKTAFAGWFCSEPEYLSIFRRQQSTRPRDSRALKS